MLKNNLANIIAMILSLAAMIQLGIAARNIGGAVGKIFKLFVAGIFFSVFIHAGVEFLEIYGLFKEEYFLPVMGVLISIGSVIFVVAGFVAVKTFKR